MHGAAVFSSGPTEAKDLFDSPMRHPGQQQGAGGEFDKKGPIRLENGPLEAVREGFPVHEGWISIGRAGGGWDLWGL
jgi:hypothetical protein